MLALAGLVTLVTPVAAGHDCNKEEQWDIEFGSHEDDDERAAYICVDPDIVEEEVPVVNVTCPTCTPGVDPSPPTPGTGHTHTPDVNPPPEPGTPPSDSCIEGVCYPAPNTVLNWAQAFLSNLTSWDPADCGPHDDLWRCYEPGDPNIGEIQNWATNSADEIATWGQGLPDRIVTEDRTVTAASLGDTYVDQRHTQDELCEAIYGDDVDWDRCARLFPSPCEHVKCPGWWETSAAVGGNPDDATLGVMVETDDATVFVPATDLY